MLRSTSWCVACGRGSQSWAFGYIGTVIGAVLADRGWPVTGIDVRQSVVDEINLGKTTVPEPGLNELVSNNVRVGRLRATTDFGAIGRGPTRGT